MTSTDTSCGRHRLVVAGARPEAPRSVRRPASLLPRSATVVAVTVGAVLVLGVQERVELPAPRPHPDAPRSDLAGPAFEPVVPAPRDGRPARIASAALSAALNSAALSSAALDPVPAGVTGRAIAGAHATGSASLGVLDAVAATQPHGGVTPENLFAA